MTNLIVKFKVPETSSNMKDDKDGITGRHPIINEAH